jgi:hypothetical protein
MKMSAIGRKALKFCNPANVYTFHADISLERHPQKRKVSVTKVHRDSRSQTKDSRPKRVIQEIADFFTTFHLLVAADRIEAVEQARLTKQLDASDFLSLEAMERSHLVNSGEVSHYALK